MILNGSKVNNIKFKKLLNGKIVKQVEEQYLRQDVPCGLTNCPLCSVNEICNLTLELKSLQGVKNVQMKFEDQNIEQQKQFDKLFIIDHQFATNHIDFIDNCQILTNVVVPDSVLKHINRKNIQSFHALKGVIEQESRHFYYFYNDNFQETYVNEMKLKGKGLDTKLKTKLATCYQWYYDHLSTITDENKVFLLTDSNQDKKQYQQIVDKNYIKGIITMEEFIKMHQSSIPELVNYMGFAGDEEGDQEMIDESIGEDLFEDHLSLPDMILGIKEGKFFQGRLNVSRVNMEEANVNVQGLNQDILIAGVKNQNRAINGDIVCIEILPESQWIKNFKASEPKNVLMEEEAPTEAELDENQVKQEDIQHTNLLDKINVEKERKVVGKVRGVIKKMNKTYGGSLLNEKDMTEETKKKYQTFFKNLQIEKSQQQFYRVFVPFNIQVPQVLIKSTKPEALENLRFIVRIKQWTKKSPFPQGQFVKILGEEGKVATESAMILHEFNVDTKEFPQKVLKCLPPEGANWQIPQEEIDKRLDLRHLSICSVDPPGCKDIDDALHFRVLPNGNYEVGVHIADVTHFVKAGAEIDKEAARRCTTVYLVEKRTDMLPGLLTENLCSIRGDVERLTFSVIWEIDSKTILPVKTEHRKTIIRSRAALNYYKAQEMIDDKNDHSELTESLRGLLKIATILRTRRNEKGALTLASPEIKFKFETERENPTDVTEYQHVSTHYMIEEFMLLANIAVAEKIAQHYPSFAILRRHPSPKQKEIQEFVELLAKFGYEMSVESSKSFADSLNRSIRQGDPFFNKLVRILATRCMHQAVYFCLADYDISEVFHYGLAVPLYTHFTSPIRRYADVLVHRLLASAIDVQSLTNEMTDKFKMSRQCDQMNRKNRMAALASQASVQFNTYLFFKNRQNDIEDAIIMKISKSGVYIMVQKYGIEGILSETDQTRIVLNPDKEEAIINDNIQVKTFDHLKVQIVAKSIEFRRSIQLNFVEKVDIQKIQVEEEIVDPVMKDAKEKQKQKKSKQKGSKGK